MASQLTLVLASVSRVSRADAKSVGDGMNRVRALLAELRADPLLNNTVERLENQLKYALSAYKRAIEAGATAAHFNAQARATTGMYCVVLYALVLPLLWLWCGSGAYVCWCFSAVDAERETLAKKLKERVEEVEKTLEELVDL